MVKNNKLTPWCVSAKIAMLEQGISTKQLAADIGMHPSYVSTILNSKVYSAPAVKRISDYLGIADSDGPTIFG